MRVVVVLIVVAWSSASVARAEDPTVALLPTSTTGAAGAPDAAAVDDVLRAILASMPGVATQAAEITAEHLSSAQALGLSCEFSRDPCLVELGPVCGTNLVVAPAITAKKIELRLAIVESGAIKKRELPWSADGAALRRALADLVAPSSVGAVAVDTAEGGAVFVDGIGMGTAPLDQPITALAPGAHTVEVRREGFMTSTVRVQVRAGQETHLVVSLVPRRPLPQRDGPALPRALVWGGGALGAAGVAGTVAGGVLLGTLVSSKLKQQDVDDEYRDGTLDLNQADERQRAQKASKATAEAQSNFDKFQLLLWGGAVAVIAGVTSMVVGASMDAP